MKKLLISLLFVIQSMTAQAWIVPSQANTVFVIEYYNASFDHYFMTSNSDEIRLLDNGAYGGAWKRIGQFFKALDGSFNITSVPNTPHVCIS